MKYTIERISASNQAEMLNFLKVRENFSLFLLSNFENYGLSLTEEPFSGNYKLIRDSKEVIGVFALTRRGSLQIKSDVIEPIFEQVLASCNEEIVPLQGLVGDYNFCEPFWAFLKAQKVIQKEIFSSKEILYEMDLKSYIPHPEVQFLKESDFSEWKILRLDYIKEKNLPIELTEEQLLNQFQDKVKKKIAWGLKVEERLVSMADLNAKALDLGQVGGVYTKPESRQRGYSKTVMSQLINDCKNIHLLRKLIIFTGEANPIAQKLYESLGAQHIGYFSLLFGE